LYGVRTIDWEIERGFESKTTTSSYCSLW